MTDETASVNVLSVLDLLENLNSQWTEFSCTARDLAARFEIITDETDLAAAVQELVKLCRNYPYLWMLLVKQASSKRPPSPTKELKFNPKEIANRYHSLLTNLKEIDPPKGNANDC